MKKLRESVVVKFVAWVLCIVSILGAAGLTFLILAGVDAGWFGQTRDETMKSTYETVNAVYSVRTFEDLGNRRLAEEMRENGFRYGVIKSNSLSGINLHDRLTYLDTNMTDEELAAIDPDKLFLYQMARNQNGSTDGIRRGYYGDYDDIAELDVLGSDLLNRTSGWSYLYADRICYDVAGGIIYYRAEGNYYPVQNVSLCYNGSEGAVIYNYNYDFNSEGYKLSYKGLSDGTAWIDGSIKEAQEAENVEMMAEEGSLNHTGRIPDAAQQPAVTDRVEQILGGDGAGSIVSLAALNDTSFNYKNWGTILLDNIRGIRGDELMLIDSGNIAEGYFIDEAGYYLNEDYTLVVREDIQADMYWIVSVVPDHVPADLMKSMYNQNGWFVNLYYDMADRNLIQGLGVSILVMALSLGFLLYAAGHRRAMEGIALTPVDRIPLEIFSVLAGAAEFGLLFLVMIIMEETEIYTSPGDCLGLYGLLGVMMTVVAVAYVLSLCVRVKAGKWWRNSICYGIYSRIRDIVAGIFRNIGVLWKVILIVGVMSVIEFWLLVTAYSGYYGWIVLLMWLAGRLVICAVLSVLVLQVCELQKAGQCMAEGDLSYKVNTAGMFWECRKHGENLNKISEGMSKAVDERMKSERLKTELITNVSHDIKTPLTSIINYVDLLSREELHNDKAAEYIEVLDRQSSKLKKLIEDLVEASKASSGNLAVDIQQLEAGVFVTQTVGEFEEKLSIAGLELIVSKPEEPVYIMADGRHIWRVIDNLMNNICKYAQAGSRVYVNLERTGQNVSITFRNISKYPLNISGEELMERFVRGDKSRNTEGHGLGLSIAQSLMNLIGGSMRIVVDGDLFKVVLAFDWYVPDIDLQEKENANIDSDSRNLV